jgi:hypothetical protein
VGARLRPHLPLVAILAVAVYVRLCGLHFGLPHPLVRPDESTIGSIATGFYHGDLNPHFFAYPALFMLSVAFVLFIWLRIGWFLGYFRDREAMDSLLTTTTSYETARLLSAAAGTATVWVVYRIACRLFDRASAIAASVFLALAFLHVRDSHFGVTDVAATFVATVAFLFIVRLAEQGGWRDLVASAVFAGLATSTKYNVALIAVPALAAVAWTRRRRLPAATRLLRVIVFGAIMATAFLVASPYSVLEWSRFVDALRSESQHLAAGHGIILGRGWFVHLTTTFRYALGIPVLVAGVAGLVRIGCKDLRTGVLVAAFPVSYFLLLGSGHTVFARYMLPVVPFLCLSAGYFVAEVGRTAAARFEHPHWAPAITTALIALAVAPSAWSVARFDALISRTDNRLVAASWIMRQFPYGATIANLGPEGGHVFVVPADPGRQFEYPNVRLGESEGLPDVVVVESSPLIDPVDLGGAAATLDAHYRLSVDFEVVADDPDNVYDKQDEFSLPLCGFKRIERPGPNLKVYVRTIDSLSEEEAGPRNRSDARTP